MQKNPATTLDYLAVRHVQPLHLPRFWVRAAGFGAWFLLACILVGAEWGVRWASYRRTYHYHEVEDVYWENQNTLLLYLPDPAVFWRLRPGIRLKATVAGEGAWLRQDFPRRYTWEIGVSSKGFRGPEFPAHKAPGEIRIVCFGDSRTLGEGLQEGETYPERLQRVLAARIPGRPIRVINVGQDGWSSHQGVRLLQSEVLRYSPDVAVFAFGVNDADTDWGVSDAFRARSMDTRRLAAQSVLYRSLLFYWAQKGVLQARGMIFGKTRIGPRRERPWSIERARVSPAGYDNNVRLFARECRSHGILPVILTLPVNPYQDWTHRTFQEPAYEADFQAGGSLRDEGKLPEAHERFEQAAARTIFAHYEAIAARAGQEESALVVSLDRPFNEVLPWEPLYLDEVHLNAAGARVASEFLADALETRMLPRVPTLVAAADTPRPTELIRN